MSELATMTTTQVMEMSRESILETVPIADLITTETPRLTGENLAHISMLAQMEGGLPPIIVHRPTMKVIDGIHRVRAALMQKRGFIDVIFFDGSEQDAFVLAVQANVRHGLPLTLSDRSAAASRIIRSHPEWSDRAVASVSGLSSKTVAAIRRRSATEDDAQLHTRIGRDGKARPLNSAEGRRLASILIREKPTASLREIARQTGISPGTVRDVRQRLVRNEDPVPPRQRRQHGQGPAAPARPCQTDAADATARGTHLVKRPKDHGLTMRALVRDPSLRMSSAGRLLLRWFGSHVTDEQRAWLVRNIPARWCEAIVELAHARSRDWHQFALDMESRRT
ncbi:winged helix-turn-helix transcriptional regulator [Nonomuraea sp. NPDC059023]|uniref:winged helix-turn-helix transcriptional regulator n=1 Tax=unclassified Nonomuraea TaxID=2593643 RepID=UPI00367E3468